MCGREKGAAVRHAIALALLLAALAPPSPAGAIVGGVPDSDRHANVGLLAFDVDGTGPAAPIAICAGSVISDRAFLTARHCIEPPLIPLPPGVDWVVTLDGGSPAAPVTPGGGFPDAFPACCMIALEESRLARATGVALHPAFEPGFVPGAGAPAVGRHDLAVLTFAPGTFAGVAPVVLPAGRLPAGRPRVTLVGYGAELRGGLYLPGYRKTARASFAGSDANWLLLSAPSPRGGALCMGDSGSPQFLGASNLQISVFHDTAPGCAGGPSYSQRLDTPAERAFLAQFVP
jgi:hypothetical protein